jgi:hypothetical protein
MNYLTSKELKDYDQYKYVRMEDDSFRFIGVYSNHSDIVEKDEKAKSAGMIGILEDYFALIQPGSVTLEIKTACDDMTLLERLLDKRYSN